MRLPNLSFGEMGIAFEQEWAYGFFPGEVDELFMRLNRIREATR